MKKMVAGSCFAISIALAVTSTAASAQYYAPVIVYPYYAAQPAFRYSAPPTPFRLYVPPVAYYGPNVVYYFGDPVWEFWSRQDRYRY